MEGGKKYALDFLTEIVCKVLRKNDVQIRSDMTAAEQKIVAKTQLHRNAKLCTDLLCT